MIPMCLEQVEKQRNFQDRTKHWGAFTGLTTCSLLEWKLINANSPPCADVLVIKFGVYYGHSEIGIYFLRSLKVAMDSWFEFDCQSSNFFLSSYFRFHTSKEIPWVHQEWNFTGMLQKLASTQTATEKQRNGTRATAEMHSINI